MCERGDTPDVMAAQHSVASRVQRGEGGTCVCVLNTDGSHLRTKHKASDQVIYGLEILSCS